MKRFLLVLLFCSAWAWTGTTHEAIAANICVWTQCACQGQMIYGSTVPDRVFHDNINHHYYDPNWDCPNGMWECPTEYDPIALTMARRWLKHAQGNETGCERDFAIGIASHYFYDSKVFWHRVKKEKQSMHSRWEKLVAEKYPGDFVVDEYGVRVADEDFAEWDEEFKEWLIDYSLMQRPVPEKEESNSLAVFWDVYNAGAGLVGNVISAIFKLWNAITG